MATDGNCFSSKSVDDEDPSSSADNSDPSNIYVKPGERKRFKGEDIYSLSPGSIRGKAMIGNVYLHSSFSYCYFSSNLVLLIFYH